MIFGEYDQPVPPEQHVPIVKQAFKKLGQSNYEIHLFPQASHAFVTPEGQLVPAFFETQIDWVLRQAGSSLQHQKKTN
jgi:dipeptidyl aminopeptidase/acylaminoacyl peptidase